MGLNFNKNNFRKIVENQVLNDKINHAYLIEIGSYLDDLEYVLNFVKIALLKCGFDDLENNNSRIIKQIDNNEYIDLKFIEPDGQWIKKTQLLDLQSDFRNKSLLNNKRFYIIKEAEKLNSSSANTMLKFLEEPEEDIVAILLTTNRYNIIDTIISRCQVFSLVDDNFCSELNDNIFNIIEYFKKPRQFFIDYKLINENILCNKDDARDIFSSIKEILVNYLNYGNEFNINEDYLNLLSSFSVDEIVSIIEIIEKNLVKLNFNVNYKLWLDCLFADFIGV